MKRNAVTDRPWFWLLCALAGVGLGELIGRFMDWAGM